MYCHTAKERREWLQENITTFKKVKEMKMFYELVNTALKFDSSLLKYGWFFCFVLFFSLIRILGTSQKELFLPIVNLTGTYFFLIFLTILSVLMMEFIT